MFVGARWKKDADTNAIHDQPTAHQNLSLPEVPSVVDRFGPDVPRPPREAPAAPQRRLFSNPQGENFSYRPPPLPAASPADGPEVAQRPQSKPTVTRFFTKGGGFSRRRPDVNALDAILRQHLDLPAPSPTHVDSGASPRNFFPPLHS